MEQTTRHRPMGSTSLWGMALLLTTASLLSAVHASPWPAPSPVPAPAPAGVVVADGPTTTSYADEMCRPPTVHPSDPLPPCVDIENIETLCYPNGTAPLYYAAHAQCMCHGSFFREWFACRRCLSRHGQLSEPEYDFFEDVANAASTSLCGFLSTPAATTPTAIFRDLFTSAQATMKPPAPPSSVTPSAPSDTAVAGGSGAPADNGSRSDAFAGNTEVGIYYTASGPQGPGSITGNAVSATATALALATGRPPPPPSAPQSLPPSAASSSGRSQATASSNVKAAAGPSTSTLSRIGAALAVLASAVVTGCLLA